MTTKIVFSPSLLCKAVQENSADRAKLLLGALRDQRFDSQYEPPPVATAEHLMVAPGGKSAIHFAAWKGSAEAVELLLEYGADIDQVSTSDLTQGQSAVFFAITQGRDAIVQLLLQRGARVTIVNSRGQTPRSLAHSHLQADTVQAVEDAERRQVGNGRFPDACAQWLNFSRDASTGESDWGDRDPRFVRPLPAELLAQSGEMMTSVTPRSLDPTSASDPRRSGKAALEKMKTIGALRPVADLSVVAETRLDLTEPTVTISAKLQSKGKDGLLTLLPLSTLAVGQTSNRFCWAAAAGQRAALRVELAASRPPLPLTTDLLQPWLRRLKVGDAVEVTGEIISMLHLDADRVEVTVRALEVAAFEDPDNIILTPFTPPQDSEGGGKDAQPPAFVTLEDVESNGRPPLLAALCSEETSRTITLVNDARSVQAFADAVVALLALCDGAASSCAYNPWVVGLDTEWRPWFFKPNDEAPSIPATGPPSGAGSAPSSGNSDEEDSPITPAGATSTDDAPVEIFQLGFRTGIFILDMRTLAASPELRGPLDAALGALLSEARVYKLGYELGGDLERLVASFGAVLPSLLNWRGAVDLSPLARIVFPGQVSKKRAGLSRLCTVAFGKALDKSQQLSPWHRRPFTAAQLTYGALDGAVLVKVYDCIVGSLHAKFPNANIDRYIEKNSLIFHALYRVLPSANCVEPVGSGAPRGKQLLGQTMFCAKWPRQGKEPQGWGIGSS